MLSAFSFLRVQIDRQRLHAHCILSSLDARFTAKDDDDARFGFSGACAYQNLARACDHFLGSKCTLCFVLFLKMLVSRLSFQVWDVSTTLCSVNLGKSLQPSSWFGVPVWSLLRPSPEFVMHNPLWLLFILLLFCVRVNHGILLLVMSKLGLCLTQYERLVLG